MLYILVFMYFRKRRASLQIRGCCINDSRGENLLSEDFSGEINQTQQRAYGANYAAAIHGYVNGSETVNANAILNERFKDFIGEAKRWWDFKKSGKSFCN